MDALKETPATNEILSAFDGSRITAVEHGDLDEWPSEDELNKAVEGQLWVASDLTAVYLPEKGWAKDFTSVDINAKGTEKIRAYRQLDKAWYAWIYNELKSKQSAIPEEIFKRYTLKFNLIWKVVCRWWPAKTVLSIHNGPLNYLDAQYTKPLIDKGVLQRFKARRAKA